MENNLQKRFAQCEEYRKSRRNQLKQYVPKKERNGKKWDYV